MSELDLETLPDDLLVNLSPGLLDPETLDLATLDLATLDPATLDPETLKQRIRALIYRYVDQRSPRIAWTVAKYSGALALHPALRDQPEQLRGFCRLHWHWRLLAAQCPTGASA